MIDRRVFGLIVGGFVAMSATAACGSGHQARPSAAGRVEDRFVPPTRAEGDSLVMPITLPDGTRVQLVYPSSLGIAGLGFNPEAEVSDRTVLITYTSLRAAYGDAKPINFYPRSDGRAVGLYSGAPRTMPAVRYLVFQFGPWLAEVEDSAMTDAERAIWARSLIGHVTTDGFLLLDVRPPLKNVRSTDDSIGAPRAGSPQVELFADRCSPTSSLDGGSPIRFVQGDGEHGVAWCDRATGFRVSITGPARFVDAAAHSLQLRP